VLDGLIATSVKLTSSDFLTDGTHGQIGAFTVDADHDKISVVIDGKTYSQTLSESTLNGGLGSRYDSVNKVILGGFDTTLTLRSEDDTTDGRQLTINLLNVGDIQINSTASAQSLQSALNGVFNVGNKSALNFQVGLTSADSISVALKDARTTAIYKDNDGVTHTLDITTAEGAQLASDVLDNAIKALVTLRSTVGAFQSRFGFAAANLQTGIQNTDAARGDLLDANIEQESTDFAQAQVRLQASIAVLAQANQLPQNLLKLIG
jgi:flagellin